MSKNYMRIEKVLKYLEHSFKEQPSLEELAAHVGLSTFHFQRMFRQWVGVSPKQFLEVLTLDYTKKLLASSQSLLDTSLEAGLSGPSRLHDLFVTIDSVTPGEYKIKGQGVQIIYGFHPTPFGECFIAVTKRGICALSFIVSQSKKPSILHLKNVWKNATIRMDQIHTKPFVDRIFHVHDQKTEPFSLLVKGTNFQVKVWQALIQLPPGRIISYEGLAKLSGHPTATRAVAQAVANNPVAFLIPCHRVIRKMGELGEYRWGSARKKAMIGWELWHAQQDSPTTGSAPASPAQAHLSR